MQLGDELVKEQIFFRKELRERVSWFIQLRWMAAGGAFIGSWAAYYQWRALPITALNLVVLFIVSTNLAFLFVRRRLEAGQSPPLNAYSVFAHIQIICDFIALYGLIYLTGGIRSPLLVFVVFHVILAGILLSPWSCFGYCFSVTAVLSGLMVLEVWQVLPFQPWVTQGPLWHQRPAFPEILPAFALFVAALFIVAFLVTSLKISLQKKGRELLRVSKELDTANVKLTALYKMATALGGCTELQALMDSATRHAAQIMGVKACSIKLLDNQRERLVFASAYGLSDDYAKNRGGIEIDQSPINRKIIEGSISAIGKIEKKDYFQYPEDIRREGIASLMCLPLAVEKVVMGVFCVYSAESDYFSEEDVNFFSLMADLTALSIASLKKDLAKAWFLQKAAHQLRSPLNTVLSMIEMVRRKSYGPVTEKQAKTLDRSAKRLRSLGDLVAELLQLDSKRSVLRKTVLHPVDPGAVLKNMVEPYRTLAAEKSVDLTFEVKQPLPGVVADEQLLDDLFGNLISNAVKYTPPGGRVRVGLTGDTENCIRFEVQDNGIGIPANDLPHLFTEFFRSSNAKTFTEDGTGLGLVIVKEILDVLKGTISVKSVPGQGTSVTCRLQPHAASR